MNDEYAEKFNFESLSDFDEDTDDALIDKTYTPSKQDEKMLIDETAESDVILNKAKKVTPTPKLKKNELNFVIKKKIAQAVSKFAFFFDTSNKHYSDKYVEIQAWKQIAETVNMDFKNCMKMWKSLKRSARYYARVPKIPSKSGASADEMDGIEVSKPYKDKWELGDEMSFFVPALKKTEKMISIMDPSTSTHIQPNDDSSSTLFSEDGNESVCVEYFVFL